MKKNLSEADVSKTVDNYRGNRFDPHGSYTGINKYNPEAQPVQDADDL